jgi:glyoxalase/bleomycin resistance protein/dioxygenase superfamily protein
VRHFPGGFSEVSLFARIAACPKGAGFSFRCRERLLRRSARHPIKAVRSCRCFSQSSRALREGSLFLCELCVSAFKFVFSHLKPTTDNCIYPSMPPKLDHILESSLYVDDLPRSIRFYQEIFDFPAVSGFGERGCALHAGPSPRFFCSSVVASLMPTARGSTSRPGRVACQEEVPLNPPTCGSRSRHFKQRPQTRTTAPQCSSTRHQSRGTSLPAAAGRRQAMLLLHWSAYSIIEGNLCNQHP